MLSVRVWTLVTEEMMTYIMCMTKPGEKKAARRMQSTDQPRMSIETCMEMIWKNWFKQTGKTGQGTNSLRASSLGSGGGEESLLLAF